MLRFLRPGRSARIIVPQVVDVLPHDPTAWTQGLLWHDGQLYESTGLYGSSSIRCVAPRTGKVLLHAALPSHYYGEGLARVGDNLVQLTWKEERAFVYSIATLDVVDSLRYQGQGWGLVNIHGHLTRTDGSGKLFYCTHELETIRSIDVKRDGGKVSGLNDLAFANGWIFANVLGSSEICVIDIETGVVEHVVDCSELVSLESPREPHNHILNGIAHDSTKDLFYVTGKCWERLFLIRIPELTKKDASRPT